MTLQRVVAWLASALAVTVAWFGLSAPAQAIPVFARQTGHNCQACHISYPELTAYGREFKLNGYTFGEAQSIPVAVAIMGEYDTVKKSEQTSGSGQVCSGFAPGGHDCHRAQLVQYSIFYGGRISDDFGMFGQMSSNEFPISNGDSHSNASSGGFTPTADNTEFRYVHRFTPDGALEPVAVVGLNVNNNPTMQDVWNAVPAWRFPWFPYLGAGLGPSAAPYIDNGGGTHNRVGTGIYAWIHKSVYLEASLYHSSTGFFNFMNWGSGGTEANMGDQPSDVLKGENPYVRAAYSHDWGYHSIEVGALYFKVKTNQCNPAGSSCSTAAMGSTNEYKDSMFDVQYQYNRNEPWIVSAAASYIHESNNLEGLFNYGALVNGTLNPTPLSQADHTINEVNIKGTVYYNRAYGATLGYTALSGTSDNNLYGSVVAGTNGVGSSANGSPKSNWWTLELNYLPLQNMRFSLLYQAFTKINGGGSNFDGTANPAAGIRGNDASGQNRLTLAIWWVY